jgi:hypothetical protein
MKEGVFSKPISTNGLQPMFDVFDFSLKDTANDISIGIPFDVVFFSTPSSRSAALSSFYN